MLGVKNGVEEVEYRNYKNENLSYQSILYFKEISRHDN